MDSPYLLPSGRQIDVEAIQADLRIIVENIHNKDREVAIRQWVEIECDDFRTPLQIVNRWLTLPLPWTIKNNPIFLVAAQIAKNSRLREVFEVPDDLTTIDWRSDVTSELKESLEEYAHSLCPGAIA